MSAAEVEVVEVVRSRTLLGIAYHDLLTDGRIVDGLQVTAWPLSGGRVTRAFQTASGAYGFSGLDGMRHLELPDPSVADEDLAAADPRTFVVQAVDPKGRYLDTVVTVAVPTDGLVTQGDVLDTPEDGSHDDLPIYLFPAPTRTVPTHLAVVRAQVADHDTGRPAAWCRLDVVVEPDGQARRSTGIADGHGTVIVVVAYPRFAPLPEPGDPDPDEDETPAPTPGTPLHERTWPVEVTVRSGPAAPEPPADARAPALDRVLGQQPTDLWATTADDPLPSLSADLHHGVDLILRTDGDPDARLLIEGPSA